MDGFPRMAPEQCGPPCIRSQSGREYTVFGAQGGLQAGPEAGGAPVAAPLQRRDATLAMPRDRGVPAYSHSAFALLTSVCSAALCAW